MKTVTRGKENDIIPHALILCITHLKLKQLCSQYVVIFRYEASLENKYLNISSRLLITDRQQEGENSNKNVNKTVLFYFVDQVSLVKYWIYTNILLMYTRLDIVFIYLELSRKFQLI